MIRDVPLALLKEQPKQEKTGMSVNEFISKHDTKASIQEAIKDI